MTTTVGHWIDNKEVPSTSGRTAPVYDPALGVETKRVALANAAEINAAIASAKKAFPGWSKTSLAGRQQIVFKFRELLNAKKGELAEIITSEHGKVLSDALGEITRGQEVVEFATGMLQLALMFTQLVRHLVLLASSLHLTSLQWFRCGSTQSQSQQETLLY
jgi:malonate-semialdehyde dehydrogenase (acetylating)/methylmalonate-semialdehyde dehydrogenase